MTREEKKKILDWIFENHEHHFGCEGFDIINGEDISRASKCTDGDFPYVNSLELERFINEL